MADTLKVESSMFQNGGTIPTRAAHPGAGGENVSPDLTWSAAPSGTAVFALTCHDPDAPTTVGFTHWVMMNIPAGVTHLDAGGGAKGKNPKGSVMGISDWGENQWGGMYPPPGDEPHHYHFTVYALDQPLPEDETMTYPRFNFMIRGHVLAQGEVVGRFGLPAQ